MKKNPKSCRHILDFPLSGINSYSLGNDMFEVLFQFFSVMLTGSIQIWGLLPGSRKMPLKGQSFWIMFWFISSANLSEFPRSTKCSFWCFSGICMMPILNLWMLYVHLCSCYIASNRPLQSWISWLAWLLKNNFSLQILKLSVIFNAS